MAKTKAKKINLKGLDIINTYAAGIDIGSRSHFVAVPEYLTDTPVKEFGCFTSDLNSIADWLSSLEITTVAMESTGVYWIPLFEILEAKGFDVKLVNARHVKNAPGRKKTDRIDAKWIQKLHTFGLLTASFRPNDQVCVLRSYLRQRDTIVKSLAQHIQHMQKALQQMNVLLHNVIDDITGVTGLKIIRDIVSGETDPLKLAKHRDKRCKNPLDIIAKSLQGNYRVEHVFSLKMALDSWDFNQQQLFDCDLQIETLLDQFDSKIDPNQMVPLKKSNRKKRKNQIKFNATQIIYRITGVDFTKVKGFDDNVLLKIISETGLDMSKWPTVKHFAAWLSLCPGTKITGGKIISSRTNRSKNKANLAFRLAANALHSSNCAIGAFLRRKKAQLGAQKATTATAHKLARLFYTLMKNGTEYIDHGQEYYEKKYQVRVLKNLKNRARKQGYELVPIAN
jgi:transposase